MKLFSTFIALVSSTKLNTDYTFLALQDMEKHFGVSDEFSKDFLPRFNKCMEKFDDDLMVR